MKGPGREENREMREPGHEERRDMHEQRPGERGGERRDQEHEHER